MHIIVREPIFSAANSEQDEIKRVPRADSQNENNLHPRKSIQIFNFRIFKSLKRYLF